MKIASEALKIVTHEDAEKPKKPLTRAGESKVRNDVDSSKLMDILGDIESLKAEIQERMRRIEAVKQAKALLMEETLRTEALNKKLAEFGMTMSAVRSAIPAPAGAVEEASPILMPIRDADPDQESRMTPIRVLGDVSAGLETVPDARRASQPAEAEVIPFTTAFAAEAANAPVPAPAVSEFAVNLLEGATAAAEELSAPPILEAILNPEPALDIAEVLLEVPEAASLPEASLAPSVPADPMEEIPEAGLTSPVAIEIDAAIAIGTATCAEAPIAEPIAQAEEEYRPETELVPALAMQDEPFASVAAPEAEAVPAAIPAESQFAVEARQAFDAALERLERAEAAFQHADEALKLAAEQASGATDEARRLLENSAAQLHQATGREEQAAREYHSARETLTIAYTEATERLDEAERAWKHADRGAEDARRLFEESAAKLTQALSIEQHAAADFQSAQKMMTTACETANERLEEARQFWKLGDQAATEAKHSLDKLAADLEQARSKEEAAAFDLLSARQELTTAYQFASVAAQRRLDAAEFFQKAARWAVFATAFSWIAMAWAVWFALRTIMPVWGPCILSLIIVTLAVALFRQGEREIGIS